MMGLIFNPPRVVIRHIDAVPHFQAPSARRERTPAFKQVCRAARHAGQYQPRAALRYRSRVKRQVRCKQPRLRRNIRMVRAVLKIALSIQAPVAKSLQDAIFRTSTSPTKLKLHVQFNTATNVGLLLAAEVGASLVRTGRSVLDQGPPKREGYAASAGVAQW